MNTAAFTAYREKVVSNCARVIVGKEDATEKILVSFLCGGHVLLAVSYTHLTLPTTSRV